MKEVLLLCLFGMALPTGDVYSDGALIIQLYVGTPSEFRCLSGDKVVGVPDVRDDYKDCPDNSDEQGKKTILHISKNKIANDFLMLTFVSEFAGKPV